MDNNSQDSAPQYPVAVVPKGHPPFVKGNRVAANRKHVPQPYIWTEERAVQMAIDILQYADDDDSLTLIGFYGKQGISYDDVDALDRFPVWLQAKRIAKLKIGARREEGALRGELDSSIVRASMATYDRDQYEHQRAMKSTMQAHAKQDGLTISVTSYGAP